MNVIRLLIDIGNTHTSLAVYEHGRSAERFFIRTNKQDVDPAAFKRLLKKWPALIEDVVIVSVVPAFTVRIRDILNEVLPQVRCRVVGEELSVPMSNRYIEPAEVGQDRLVLSYAAVRKYRPPVVVVDFGTAVTFDVVNADGEYEGGIIFPGMRISFTNLLDNAALIRKFVFSPPEDVPLVGKTTQESVNAGVLRGYAALCDGLISQLCSYVEPKPKIVFTGGDVELVMPYMRVPVENDKDLIFAGLYFLSED